MALFYNQATLSYQDRVTSSNIVTGEVLEILTASKTAVDDIYRPGETVVYAVSLVNTDAAPLSNLTITDDLGGYPFTPEGGTETTLYPLTYVPGSVRYFSNGVLQAAPVVDAGPPLVISGINVPAGGNAVLLYEARVNSFAPPSGSVTNTASVTGAALCNPAAATETVTAAETPELSIQKALSPASVSCRGQITYTFTIQNTGPAAAVATDDLVVSDLFDPILSDLTVTLNGAVLSPANYTYDAATGAFSTVAGVITVPAAAYTRDPVTGVWSVTPGTAVLTVTGTL